MCSTRMLPHATAYTAVVVCDSGDTLSFCTVKHASVTEAEEHTQRYKGDSKTAIESYGIGRTSAAAKEIL